MAVISPSYKVVTFNPSGYFSFKLEDCTVTFETTEQKLLKLINAVEIGPQGNVVYGDVEGVEWFDYRAAVLDHMGAEDKAPRWEDKISEDSPVLCWTSDNDVNPGPNNYIDRVDVYNSGDDYPYEGDGAWKYATPCTKAEIDQYILTQDE